MPVPAHPSATFAALKRLRLLFFLLACMFAGGTLGAQDADAAELERLSTDSLTVLAKTTSFSEPDNCIRASNLLISRGKKEKKQNVEFDGHYYKGIAFYSKGFYKASVESYLDALALAEKQDDTTKLANVYMVLGIVYYELKEYEKTEANYSKAAALYEATGNRRSLLAIENNMGLVRQQQKKYASALESFKHALALLDEVGAEERAYSDAWSNIGLTYSLLGEYDTAVVYLEKALAVQERSGDNKVSQARTLSDLSSAHVALKKYDDALRYAQQCFALAEASGNWELISMANDVLSEYYSATGDTRKAFDYHLASDVARDSVMLTRNLGDIARLETEFEYEKIIARDSVKNAEEEKVTRAQMEKQQAELKARQNQQAALYVILGLVALFALFIYNRFRFARKQKTIIEAQKNIVEVKQKEITDSINYAKRIQTAILPPDHYFRTHLPHSFILYKPKDIVAGDFYWMEAKGDLVLFAACDCTGHGVPGALVSVICNNALNRAVREFGLTDPGKILDKTREIVIAEFGKSREEVKDGMDISLCVLDKTQKTVRWAGANNPLWLFRDGALTEYKADKQPIGKHADAKPFTTHSIPLRENDMLYIFTDGYQDQFGGERGKKFKIAAMREMMAGSSNQPLHEQLKIFERRFESWKNWRQPGGEIKDHEQVDDLCIIGVRV